MTARHRAAPAERVPLVAHVLVALALSLAALAVGARSVSEPAPAPPDPTSRTSCAPTTTAYADGSVWHGCAATPPPVVLPPDPFPEEDP